MKTNTKIYIISFIFGLIASASAFAFDEDGLPLLEDLSSQAVKAPTSTTSGSCAASKLSYAQSDISVSTQKKTFVNVPGMGLRITIPGTSTTCVEVQYTATVFSAQNELIYVRATRDGVQCLPGEVQFEGDSDEDGDGKWARAHAFNFICTGVSPGAHTFRIQWRSFFGGTVFTHKRTMVVHHK